MTTPANLEGVITFLSGLLQNLLVSMLTTMLIILGAWLFSKRIRRTLTALTSNLLGVDVKYVYADKKAAEKEIDYAVKRSKTIRLLTGRGNELQRDPFSSIMNKGKTKRPYLQVLLPDTRIKRESVDWVDYREREAFAFDESFRNGVLRRQIETNLQLLAPRLESGQLEARLFDLPHFGRVLLTDDDLFLTPYTDTAHGRDNRVIQFGRGDMYQMYARFFAMIWEGARPLIDPSDLPAQ